MLTFDVTLDRGRFHLRAAGRFTSQVTGLLGVSGSGKSTLLEIIAGLARPDHGAVVWNNEVLVDTERKLNVPAHHRGIGMVFQDSQLFPHYTVSGNLEYGYRLTPPNKRRFTPSSIIELLALGPLLKAHVKDLSGGERQRVAFGRALLASPRLLLLDEPMAALDQARKQEILPFLTRVRDELALPMIYVSHLLPEVLHLTDDLVFMHDGRIDASGKLAHLLATSDRTESVWRLGWHNILEVTIQSHSAEQVSTVATCGGLSLAMPYCPRLPPGQHTYVSISHHEISLSRAPVTDISIQNQFPATVTAVKPGTDGVLVHLDAGVPLVADITHRAARDLQLTLGSRINCLVKGRAIGYLAQPQPNHG